MNWDINAFDISLTNAVATGFASYAITIFLVKKHGPWQLFRRFRTFVGMPLRCTTCAVGFWVLLALCLVDVSLIVMRQRFPFGGFLLSFWMQIKFFFSASGVGMSLMALTGQLNLDEDN